MVLGWIAFLRPPPTPGSQYPPRHLVSSHPPRGGFCDRDVFVGGDCDAGCLELAALLGWEEDLQKLINAAAAAASN